MRSMGIGRRRAEQGPHAKRGEATPEAEEPATTRCVEVGKTVRRRPRVESTQAADTRCINDAVGGVGRSARPWREAQREATALASLVCAQ
jgi:hypothetical protein